MFKKLLIVAASAATLAFVSIGAAFMIDGPGIRAALDNDNLGWEIDSYDGPITTTELQLDADRDLDINIPAELTFTRSETSSMIVEGPQDALDDLVYKDGSLDLSGNGYQLGDGLKITITGPRLPGLNLNAPGDITLIGLDQDRLALSTNGAADLTAKGKVRTLELETNGAANLDFRDVEATDATVEINGAGDIDLAASGLVRVEINGAGSITLHVKPANVESEINGVGSVDHAY
jgi:Putative auto-transporter adhesin, head GIN domain